MLHGKKIITTRPAPPTPIIVNKAMNITIEQLIQCVKESVKTLTVKMPEYEPIYGYRCRTGEWVEEYVDVVDPVTLIDELEKLMK